MKNRGSGPEINISRITVGGGVAGLIFTVGSMLIFALGIPALWYFLAGAIALGVVIAFVLHCTEK